jgi:hypothetical protein
MEKRPPALAALVLGLLAAASGAAAGGEPQVLLWIRAGALAPGEVELDGEAAPNLRALVLSGVTALDLEPPQAGAIALGDPGALAGWLLDPSLRASIEARRGAPVREVGSETSGLPSDGDGKERRAETARWSHPVLKLLEPHFGAPPPPSEEEEAAVRRLRAVIGAQTAAGGAAPWKERPTAAAASGTGRGQDPGRAPPGPDPAVLSLALSALRALDRGSPLVVVREPVADPAAAGARDLLLGKVAASAREAGAILLVLSVKGGRTTGAPPPAGPGAAPAAAGGEGETRISLVAAGPGVRSGRILNGRRPLAAVSGTLFDLLGVPPPAGRTLEVIDVRAR